MTLAKLSLPKNIVFMGASYFSQRVNGTDSFQSTAISCGIYAVAIATRTRQTVIGHAQNSKVATLKETAAAGY
jgi:hypothetical protein